MEENSNGRHDPKSSHKEYHENVTRKPSSPKLRQRHEVRKSTCEMEPPLQFLAGPPYYYKLTL